MGYTLHELGVCLEKAGRHSEAEEMLGNALAITKANLGGDDLQVATTLHELGVCLRKGGWYVEAEEALR